MKVTLMIPTKNSDGVNEQNEDFVTGIYKMITCWIYPNKISPNIACVFEKYVTSCKTENKDMTFLKTMWMVQASLWKMWKWLLKI